MPGEFRQSGYFSSCLFLGIRLNVWLACISRLTAVFVASLVTNGRLSLPHHRHHNVIDR
ncbi:MAG: hypothetical protein H6668_17535 [Ardenticatenaceae bacterium]|nr:hypothetical protein [Ardenticatenaceae bacterium]